MPYAQVLEETGPGGTKVYAYGNDLLNMQGPEGTQWFVYDGLGSTRALTDQAGTLTDAYIYEAFGSLIHRTGTTANEFLFTGEQWEPGVGMYYLRARYYEPLYGRFIIEDTWPIDKQIPQTLNRYAYCLNNPVGYTDLSGFSVNWGLIVKTLKKPIWIIGTLVHYEIYDWFKQNIDRSARCNQQVFKYFGINLKPDIVSLFYREIYEIKPDSDFTDNGYMQLQEYINLANQYGIEGIFGFTGGLRCQGVIKRAKRLLGMVDIIFWHVGPGLVYYTLYPSETLMVFVVGMVIKAAINRIELLAARVSMAIGLATMGVY